MNTSHKTRDGSCLCGAVTYKVEGELTHPLTCHCKQCRRQSGHYFAAAHAPAGAIRFLRDDGLAWYRASDTASRGFCKLCGSTLFWHGDGMDGTMVLLGALDGPTGLKLECHYWVDMKGDYYELSDGLPQREGIPS